ncbi:MAG TPA: hypothetical protein VEC99_15435, partial [Clostridia bacterium]|nr:hypothetical protein [Clostridia bacterium]
MNKSPLTTGLLAVLAIVALWSVWLCWNYISSARELRNLQAQVNMINFRQAALTSLANDALEYSKHNSAIDPILETFNIKQKGLSSALP